MQFKRRNLVFYCVLLTVAATIFGSCLKSVENTPPKKYTYLSILHLAPASPAADVYLNNTKSTNQPIPAGSFFSRYSPLDPDAYSIVFKKGGGDSVIASLPSDIYDSLQYSTVMLYNNPVGPGVSAIRIDDDFSTLNMTQSNFRFFHVSPGLMPVDLYFDNVKVASSRQYADNTFSSYYNLFQARDGGLVNLIVKKAGTDSVIVQTNSTLQAAQVYTIMLTGVAGGTGDNALALDVLQASN